VVGCNSDDGTRERRLEGLDEVVFRADLSQHQRLSLESPEGLEVREEFGRVRIARDGENVPFSVMGDPARQDELARVATSGLMALTGQPAGPPLEPPPGLVRGLDRLVAAIGHWSTKVGSTVDADWAHLLTARARIMGLRRQGRTSPSGSCRLLKARDGWMAINLPRPDDRAAVSALLQSDAGADPWEAIGAAVTLAPVSQFVERARLLGIPTAALGRPEKPAAPWSVQRFCASAPPRAIAGLRIVDLSSMWAGPLAARLIADCGARIVKVESSERPDGARAVPDFYKTMHHENQEVITLNFRSPTGRRKLGTLLADADVVIESSRPRALEQLELSFDKVRTRPGKVWASVTGYGRSVPGRDWVAFGDDAAVAGGLVAWEDGNHPVFCGDAIGDPIAGMTAASAILQAVASGGGLLLDVSMRSGVANLLDVADGRRARRAHRGSTGWEVVVRGETVTVVDPCEPDHSDRCTTRPATTVATTELD
jgi:CoA-transferase family III